MPTSPEKRREFDRLLRRERISRMLDIAPPIAIGGGLFCGLIWMRSHGGPPWISLLLAGSAALAKPAIFVVRMMERRRKQNKLD